MPRGQFAVCLRLLGPIYIQRLRRRCDIAPKLIPCILVCYCYTWQKQCRSDVSDADGSLDVNGLYSAVGRLQFNYPNTAKTVFAVDYNACHVVERKLFADFIFQYVVGGEGDADAGATPTDATRLLRAAQVPGGDAEPSLHRLS